MSYLLFSIIFSTGLNVLFKLFSRYELNLFKVIMINYWVCYGLGQIWSGQWIHASDIVDKPWFYYAIFLGFTFVIGFNMAGITVKYFGIVLATIMQKMSLLLTVLFAILYFGETLTYIKAWGLLFAFIAVVLIHIKKPETRSKSIRNKIIYIIPLLTLLLSGTIEILFLLVDRHNIVLQTDHAFVTVLFGFAGMFALVFYLIGRSMYITSSLTFSDLGGGLVLGCVNFFSIFFLMKLVQTGWEGSFLFPINNVGILLLSALVSLLLFREKLSRINYIGLAVSILAIWFVWNSGA